MKLKFLLIVILALLLAAPALAAPHKEDIGYCCKWIGGALACFDLLPGQTCHGDEPPPAEPDSQGVYIRKFWLWEWTPDHITIRSEDLYPPGFSGWEAAFAFYDWQNSDWWMTEDVDCVPYGSSWVDCTFTFPFGTNRRWWLDIEYNEYGNTTRVWAIPWVGYYWHVRSFPYARGNHHIEFNNGQVVYYEYTFIPNVKGPPPQYDPYPPPP
jgi:hypothetical protein